MNTLLLLSLSLAAHAAQPARYPFARAHCKLGAKKFDVKIESLFKPGDPNDESEGGQFLSIGARLAEKRTGPYLSDGAYTFVKPGKDSVCDKTSALPVGDKLVAVLYQADNRPFQEILHVAFYDPAARKVVKVESDLGPLGDVIPAKGGFAFSNEVARSDADAIKHKSPWGKELSGMDQDLAAYRRVIEDEGKIHIAFDPSLSYEESPWKEFYATEKDYLDDAGWDPATSTFRNKVVYAASYFNRKEGPEEQKCIAMVPKRGAPIADDHWRCRKIQH